MGKVILQIYENVEQKAGLKARLNMVQQTGISRNKAGMVEEDDEIIKLFKDVALKITGINVEDYL